MREKSLSVLLYFIGLVLLSFGCGDGSGSSEPAISGASPFNCQSGSRELSPAERTSFYEKQKRSVVEIRALRKVEGGMAVSQGTGFVWENEHGLIVTNQHVVGDQPDQVWVNFSDGESFAAEVVASNEDHDLAFLVTDAPKSLLVPVETGDSSSLKVGEEVFAIGHPHGKTYSFNRGDVTGPPRFLNVSDKGWPLFDLIQSDAAINSGNSGGPLFNSCGQVVGVNVAVGQEQDGGLANNMSYSIPISKVASNVAQIIDGGHTNKNGEFVFGELLRPRLGFTIESVFRTFPEIAERVSGVVVLLIMPGTKAAEADLKAAYKSRTEIIRANTDADFRVESMVQADIITHVNGVKVDTTKDFYSALDPLRPGSALKLTVYRESSRQSREVDVELISLRQLKEIMFAMAEKSQPGATSFIPANAIECEYQQVTDTHMVLRPLASEKNKPGISDVEFHFTGNGEGYKLGDGKVAPEVEVNPGLEVLQGERSESSIYMRLKVHMRGFGNAYIFIPEDQIDDLQRAVRALSPRESPTELFYQYYAVWAVRDSSGTLRHWIVPPQPAAAANTETSPH